MADRGEYRAIHVALIDDPDFLQLSPPARLALMTLKLILGASGIDVVRALVPELMATTGYDEATIRAAVDELTAGRWILIEGRVVWLRNGLRFEPSKPLASENGRKGISAHLATLPRVALVNRFADYYGLPRPFPELDDPADSEGATEPPSNPLPTPSEPPTEAGIRDEGRGMRDNHHSTTSHTRTRDARETALDRLRTYLGPHADAVDRFCAAAPHSATWAAAILGLYGPEGTDQAVWQRSPPEERPSLLARALDRYAGESRPYHGKLFRRFLEDVIHEHCNDDRRADAHRRGPAANGRGAAARAQPVALGAGDPSRRSGWVYE